SSVFYRKITNGEVVPRIWLIFSKKTNKVFCSICRMFSKVHDHDQFSTGYNDWKNASARLSAHENSQHHRQSLLFWISRNGNYLGILELLAQYDAFLAKHMEKYKDVGCGKISYLSSTICDEFIKIILSGMSTLVVSSHKGESLAECIFHFLSENEIDIDNCRSQSYDNASNMSGKYKGVQSYIEKGDILERMNKVNEFFQSNGLILKTVTKHMDSLCEFVKVVRKDFDTYEKDALRLAKLLRYKSDGEISYRRTSGRKIKREPQFDEEGEVHHHFSPREKFKTQTFIAVCDSLITEISKRTEAYRCTMNNFEFIFHYEEDNVSKKRAAAAKLMQKYSNGLKKELENEIIHFHEHVKQTVNDASNVIEAMKTILSSGCFPNVAIALRIYLSMPCTVCEGERSFSKLTRIKDENRTTVGEERLNALSIIAIEWDLARKMDFSNLIREFTS
uniref:TTF-type domain-containing protein n=1 Tax=Latimeria chalumnae TaxID=7897 RepID=H3B2S5_LATCH